jgi:hypothetical protein
LKGAISACGKHQSACGQLAASLHFDFEVEVRLLKRRLVDREEPTLLYLSSACERLKLDLSLGRPLSPCMLAKATSGTNEWVVDFLEPDTGLIGRRGVLCMV